MLFDLLGKRALVQEIFTGDHVGFLWIASDVTNAIAKMFLVSHEPVKIAPLPETPRACA